VKAMATAFSSIDPNKNKIAIQTNNLTKNFGTLCAVDHLNLQIERGTVYGLLGPNGAGKSVTIKILCGLLKPTSGSASLLGKSIPDRKINGQMGYMPQDISLYLGLTVHENIRFFGKLQGLRGTSLDEREPELLQIIDLEDRKRDLVGDLSGGMQHRVSLACSFIHHPILMFLDEPTVGVDPELRDLFWKYFRKLASQGVTMLITTHYMDEARHCDRIGFMRNGSLFAEGTPDALLKKTGTDSLEDAFLALARGELA